MEEIRGWSNVLGYQPFHVRQKTLMEKTKKKSSPLRWIISRYILGFLLFFCLYLGIRRSIGSVYLIDDGCRNAWIVVDFVCLTIGVL